MHKADGGAAHSGEESKIVHNNEEAAPEKPQRAKKSNLWVAL